MTARSLPPRPNLTQLKRQAKELLRHQPQVGRLRDAQRTIAGEYGFASWDALRSHVQSVVGAVSRSMKRWISSGAADAVEKAAILLDSGADISARDEEYRSTPLAWAARSGAVEMVKFLLSRGVSTHHPDDEPWATPLAWAERRQHPEVLSILRQHRAS